MKTNTLPLTETHGYIVETQNWKLTELDVACMVIRAIFFHKEYTPVGVSSKTIHGRLRFKEHISIEQINAICERLKGNTILTYCQETNQGSNDVISGWKLAFAR